jgi:hypothetical protein
VIIASAEEYKPGTVVKRAVAEADVIHPAQPLFVIRECTRQEWLDECFERFGKTIPAEGLLALAAQGYQFYYEVSTD